MPMAAPQRRRHQAAFLRSEPPAPANGKPAAATNGRPAAASSKPKSPAQAPPPSLEERTVKQLRLTKALTLPEATAVSEACMRMAARHADAALLTDAKGVLSGIVTAEVLRLHMDDGSKISADPTPASSVDTSAARRSWPSLRLGRVASAAAIAGIGAIVYLRCSRQ